MLTLCAWCEKEGTRTVLQEGPADGEISHGICAEHARQMREELREYVGVVAHDVVSGRAFLLPARDKTTPR